MDINPIKFDKQLLRSETSVGANINEAIYGNSKADFISKLHIALKEIGESIYWFALFKRTNLFEYDFDRLLSLAEEIKRILITKNVHLTRTSKRASSARRMLFKLNL